MKKRKVYIILIFIIAGLLTAIILLNTEREKQVCFENHCFIVELAKTSEERSRGLMFRDQFALTSGMLFIFKEEGNYSFWMKNTLIPLDIVWINKQKEVVFMENNAKPCIEDPCQIIKPGKEATYVLEINTGIVGELNIKIGDIALFKNIDF